MVAKGESKWLWQPGKFELDVVPSFSFSAVLWLESKVMSERPDSASSLLKGGRSSSTWSIIHGISERALVATT